MNSHRHVQTRRHYTSISLENHKVSSNRKQAYICRDLIITRQWLMDFLRIEIKVSLWIWESTILWHSAKCASLWVCVTAQCVLWCSSCEECESLCCSECMLLCNKRAAPCVSAGAESSRSRWLQAPKVFLQSAERPAGGEHWKLTHMKADFIQCCPKIPIFSHLHQQAEHSLSVTHYVFACTDLRLLIICVFLTVNKSHKKVKIVSRVWYILLLCASFVVKKHY